jgi:hypothetical protein
MLFQQVFQLLTAQYVQQHATLVSFQLGKAVHKRTNSIKVQLIAAMFPISRIH